MTLLTLVRPVPRNLRLSGLLALLVGCAAPMEGTSARRTCDLVAWYRPEVALLDPTLHLTREQAEHPELIGSWDGFHRPGLLIWDARKNAAGTEWMAASVPLPPGSYTYVIVVGGQRVTDDRNPQTTFIADPLSAAGDPFGAEVSVAEVADCSQPLLSVSQIAASPAPGVNNMGAQGQGQGQGTTGTGGLVIEATFVAGEDGAALDRGATRVELFRGQEHLAAPALSVTPGAEGDDNLRISATTAGLPPGKYQVVFHAADHKGRMATASASAFVEAQPAQAERSLKDGILYHLMIDRFWGNGPLSSPTTPGNRAGGTLAGVRQLLLAGHFERLGVSTLWLSPVYENPPGKLPGRDGHLYQGYHGYWPAAARGVESQIGGDLQLEQLIADAHARGIRVILDSVPHHVHESHPYYLDHSRKTLAVAQAADPRTASWFIDGPEACVCGDVHCGWGDHIQTCWFDTYLPTLNWRQPEAAQTGVQDLMFWMSRFDIDGLRIDAVPMMPRAATRRIARDVRGMMRRDGLDLLLLGETYTGPGDDGRAQIRSYLGSQLDGLDSEFDFPLMWAMRNVIAHGQGGMDTLEAEIAAGDRAWAGSGAVISHIAGNHDTTRFVSEAANDAGGDPWNGTAPAQPTAQEPYQRHLLAMALVMTLPGLPILYYGDEVALAGGGDPDSRRPLPDVLSGSLPAPQREVLRTVALLGRLRACLPALRRGLRQPLWTDADHTVALHRLPDGSGESALSVLSRGAAQVHQTISGLPPGSYRDVLSQTRLNVGANGLGELTLARLSAAIFIPETSPCSTP